MEIITLPPGTTLTDRSQNFTSQLIEKLERFKPVGVAVAGYDRPEMRNALRWANRQGAASVLMSETKVDDRARPWWKRKLITREVQKARAALVSGAAAGEYLVSLGFPREKVFRHYGAVDNAYFRERAYRRRRDDRRGFLTCCRLIETRKNIYALLAAYRIYRLKTSRPWDLVICGDGPDRARYEAYARKDLVYGERIEGVTFAGFQQVDALAGYYARAGCLVHPAVNEAWGLVVNEALASGLPVLVSRRCGCAYDLVHEGINGYTFDPSDIGGMSEALLKMSELRVEHRIAMGDESLRIVSRYGCEAFAMGLERAFDSCWKTHMAAPEGENDSQERVQRGEEASESTMAPVESSGGRP